MSTETTARAPRGVPVAPLWLLQQLGRGLEDDLLIAPEPRSFLYGAGIELVHRPWASTRSTCSKSPRFCASAALREFQGEGNIGVRLVQALADHVGIEVPRPHLRAVAARRVVAGVVFPELADVLLGERALQVIKGTGTVFLFEAADREDAMLSNVAWSMVPRLLMKSRPTRAVGGIERRHIRYVFAGETGSRR